MLWAVLHLTLQLALQLILQVLGRGSDSSAIYYVVYVVCPEDLIVTIQPPTYYTLITCCLVPL